MKFGIMLPHYRQVASADGIYRMAQEAESMGFHSVWVASTSLCLTPTWSVSARGTSTHLAFWGTYLQSLSGYP
jgi:alkanesulfonate monooxygenase SsuD/methylene tetrahydromethanopterin reductase-like flavin-dependent oxidoreductase (luciferase family)